jgi:hypothetical protein
MTPRTLKWYKVPGRSGATRVVRVAAGTTRIVSSTLMVVIAAVLIETIQQKSGALAPAVQARVDDRRSFPAVKVAAALGATPVSGNVGSVPGFLLKR